MSFVHFSALRRHFLPTFMIILEPMLLTPFAWEVLSAICDRKDKKTILPKGHMPVKAA